MDILICFDGTANEPNRGEREADGEPGDAGITNVLKLHLCAGGVLTDEAPRRDAVKIPGQLSIYLAGVGTRGNVMLRRLRQVFALSKPRRIREKALEKLSAVYEKGDRLFVFGFSRGAAIARKFCAQIAADGLRTRSGEHDPEPIVELLAAWDTVAALRASPRLLSRNQEPDTEELLEDGPIAPNIRQAVHLVALDEKRLAFRPTLMESEARVREIWFPGVHSDVGGGFRVAGLSDIALDFVLDVGRDLGLRFIDFDDKPETFTGVDQNGDAVTLGREELTIRPDPAARLHQQERGALVSSATLAPRRVMVLGDAVDDEQLPVVHHSVVQRMAALEDYRPAALDGVPHRVLEADESLRRAADGLDDHLPG